MDKKIDSAKKNVQAAINDVRGAGAQGDLRQVLELLKIASNLLAKHQTAEPAPAKQTVSLAAKPAQ